MTLLLRHWIMITIILPILATLSGCGREQNSSREGRETVVQRPGESPVSEAPSESRRSDGFSGTDGNCVSTDAMTEVAVPLPWLEVYGSLECQPDGPPPEPVTVWLSGGGPEAPPVAETQSDSRVHYRMRVSRTTEPLVLYALVSGFALAGTILPSPEELSRLEASSDFGDLRIRVDLTLHRASFLRGKVADDSGRPLSGARVQLARLTIPQIGQSGAFSPAEASLQTWETISDADGRFAFEGIPAGALELEVSAPGHVTGQRSVEPPAESLLVTLSAHGVGVTGYVFEQATGAGVPGAEIRLSEVAASLEGNLQARSWTTVTDALGAFSFCELPEGSYRVTGRKGDLVLRSRDGLLASQVTLTTGETTPELTLLLFPGFTITGRVTDQLSQESLEGVEVSALGHEGKTALTDADGRYSLSGIAPGAGGLWAMLRFRKEGYETDIRKRGALIPVRLDPDAKEIRHDQTMHPAVAVSGRVMTADGRPVAGAMVAARQTGGKRGQQEEHVTDGTGHYEIIVPAMSAYRFFAWSKEYGSGYSALVVLDRESTSGVDIVVAAPASVEGTVTDEDGKPIPEASVSVIAFDQAHEPEPMGHEQADAAGAFRLRGLPAGIIVLRASSSQPGLVESEPQKLDLAPGETRKGVRIVLPRMRIIATGTLVDEEGTPLPDHIIYVIQESSSYNVRSDEQGRFHVHGVPGQAVSLWTGGDPYEILVVKDLPAERDDLRLVLRRARTLNLIANVVDAVTSEPVGQFEILSVMNDQPFQSRERKEPASIDRPAPGLFTISGVPAGSYYRVILRAPGYRLFDSGMLRAPSGDEVPDSDMAEVTFALVPLSVP